MSSSTRSDDELYPKWRRSWDVFMSFCGKDTGDSFASDLYTALKNAGIAVVFREEYADKVRSDEEQIPLSVLDAIEESRISVIVFSTNYADSRPRLQELEKIMECRSSIDQIVVPVFFDVDPSQVRNQTGIFGEAFERLLTPQRVLRENWRLTLQEAGSIQGFTVMDSSSRNQSNKLIKTVVASVGDLLYKIDLPVAERPVGIKPRVKEVVRLLNCNSSNNVLILGICGMGGIGKTAIALATYNKVHHNFETTFFNENIRDNWEQCGGAVLQKLLLSRVCRTTTIEIDSVESGKTELMKRLSRRKILLVLDDVNKMEQLNALCGSRDWFGKGSRIIITTRNPDLLHMLEVDHVYRMKEMDEKESLELFSWHAFKQPIPREDFVELSRDVVEYSVGLPLALKVIGEEKIVWQTVLEKLKIMSNDKLYTTLKISFDDLSDDSVKEVFLEIASFFIGMDRDDVVEILNDCGYPARFGIHVLLQQNLITVDNKSKIRMHRLLRDMGREIIRRESHDMSEVPKEYDVFLSFRGKDTRASFISHLHASLQNVGLHVFKDDDEISRGERISLSLLRAIRSSRIAIVVLSRNYANSRWCMTELECIMENCRRKSLVVVPVFYGVDPSEVRNQIGEFGKAFDDLVTRVFSSEDSYKVESWQRDLLEVGGRAGFVILNSKSESQDIREVVASVTDLLGKTDLHVAEHPVGIESRVKEVVKLLNCNQTNNVLILGIWGMGGIGKTTIAKATYNQVRRNFEAKSFLLSVREAWEENNGKVSLQQRLLCDVYKTITIKIDSVEHGKMILKERLGQKKIFLVLDDVNEWEQMSALCVPEWFRKGSRIIITTRDEDMLRRFKDKYQVYIMEKMDEKESLELFSWHAFKQPEPEEGFAELSRDVVEYSGGLPLALQVIGSFLLKRGKREWKSVLKKLRVIPDKEVLTKLRISFDGLKDDTVKELFLDIAFFFIGMDRDDVIKILNDDRGFSQVIGMSILMQQSLVTVDNRNKLGMHDLIRDMGREIVREKSPYMAAKRCRLWHRDDVLDVLSKNTKAETIKGLTLKSPSMEVTRLKSKAFENLENLRLLQLSDVKLDGDYYKYLSRDLRWLSWHRFPFKNTPLDLYQANLVAIELKYSNLEGAWNKSQMLKKLKFLNLSHSTKLRQTPDFSKLPNLEKLILKGCSNLSSISHTIGNLSKILLINLKDCKNLQTLPRSIYKLKSLKTLILSGCLKIDKLEEDIEQMESLNTLVADTTNIKKVPFAVVRSKSIGYISLCGFEGFARDVFPSLVRSWVSPTKSVFSSVETFFSVSSSLACLDEQNSFFHDLSSIIEDLQKLQRIWVKCKSAAQLHHTVQSILNALDTNHEELEASPSTSSTFVDYGIQFGRTRSRKFLTSLLFRMGMNCHIATDLKGRISQLAIDPGLLPGNNYPDWLTFIGEGSSVTLVVPEVDGRDLKTMMCVVHFSSPDNITSQGLQNVLVINYTKTTFQLYKRDGLAFLDEEEEWQKLVSNIEPGDQVKFVLVLGAGLTAKQTAVYFLYDEPTDEMTKHCPEPYHNSVIASSGGDENRFGRLSSALPSCVRAVLISWPFCFILVAILFWYGCHWEDETSF